MNRAVRFIRHNAREYGIDPDRIGVYGGSAGGHLSLMLGMAGDNGDPNAKDPVDRESSRVQAVACFFPPTDLLNFGKPGKEMIHTTDHRPPSEPPSTTGNSTSRACSGFRSPMTSDSGDHQADLADHLRHARRSADTDHSRRRRHAGTAPAIGTDHGQVQEDGRRGEAGGQERRRTWLGGSEKDLIQFADWFDQHLKKGSTQSPSAAHKLIPQIDGDWWQIAGNPDLGN